MGEVARLFKEPQKPRSLKDQLKATAVKEEPKAKSSVRQAPPAPDNVRGDADAIGDAQETKKKAEAIIKRCRVSVEGYAREIMIAEASKGRYQNSWRIMGNRHDVKVVWKDAFTKISPDDEAAIREIVGEHFDKLFRSGFQVNVRPEVLDDEDLGAELLERFGADWDKYLETREVLEPRKENWSQLAWSLLTPEQMDNLGQFVKQYAPQVS